MARGEAGRIGARFEGGGKSCTVTPGASALDVDGADGVDDERGVDAVDGIADVTPVARVAALAGGPSRSGGVISVRARLPSVAFDGESRRAATTPRAICMAEERSLARSTPD